MGDCTIGLRRFIPMGSFGVLGFRIPDLGFFLFF